MLNKRSVALGYLISEVASATVKKVKNVDLSKNNPDEIQRVIDNSVIRSLSNSSKGVPQ
jgi:hypothetical protein